MGYSLNAIICNADTALEITNAFSHARKIEIHKNLFLIPLVDWLFDEIIKAEKPSEFHKINFFDAKIQAGLVLFSQKGKLALVEAAYHGGVGDQSAIVWEDGKVIFSEMNGEWSINKVLKLLGVIKGDDKFDEFDTVELGMFRETDTWYENAE